MHFAYLGSVFVKEYDTEDIGDMLVAQDSSGNYMGPSPEYKINIPIIGGLSQYLICKVGDFEPNNHPSKPYEYNPTAGMIEDNNPILKLHQILLVIPLREPNDHPPMFITGKNMLEYHKVQK